MKNNFRALLGALLLLMISFSVYALRYPIWSLNFVEPIFVVLILSYLTVFVVALLLLKKDMDKSLKNFFRFRGFRWILAGIAFAVLFQAVWITFSLGLGGTVNVSFDDLRGYAGYAFYSLPLAFALYCTFAVFGAFTEEVAYRGYVQSKVSLNYGVTAGITVSALFFALQHLHIFQLNWIVTFFQGQFIYVLFFGLFAGYFFFKSKHDIWAVVVFHGLMNFFNIALPIQTSTPFIFTDWLRTILSFTVLIASLYFMKTRPCELR